MSLRYTVHYSDNNKGFSLAEVSVFSYLRDFYTLKGEPICPGEAEIALNTNTSVRAVSRILKTLASHKVISVTRRFNSSSVIAVLSGLPTLKGYPKAKAVPAKMAGVVHARLAEVASANVAGVGVVPAKLADTEAALLPNLSAVHAKTVICTRQIGVLISESISNRNSYRELGVEAHEGNQLSSASAVLGSGTLEVSASPDPGSNNPALDSGYSFPKEEATGEETRAAAVADLEAAFDLEEDETTETIFSAPTLPAVAPPVASPVVGSSGNSIAVKVSLDRQREIDKINAAFATLGGCQ